MQGDESEVVRKIRSGRRDGGAPSATGLAQIYRTVQAFQLSVMFRTPEGFMRALKALRPELEAGFERAGFPIINLSPAPGPRMLSTREIQGGVRGTPANARGSGYYGPPVPWRSARRPAVGCHPIAAALHQIPV